MADTGYERGMSSSDSGPRTLPDRPRRVAVLLGPDFEDSEFETPRTTLMELGHRIDVIGSSAGSDLTGKRGVVTATTEFSPNDVTATDYDAVLVPGGYSPDHLRLDDGMIRFLRDAADAGTPIAAICHAGSLLIEAGLVEGRRVTSWPSIRTDLENAGAHWVDEDVVFDGPLITSRGPDDLPAFTEALTAALGDSART
jgi:protease I